MADYVKTITNGINIFGLKTTTKWGNTAFDSMVWGSSKWGNGISLLTDFTKVYGDSAIVSSAVFKDAIKVLSDSVAPTSTVFKTVDKLIINSEPITSTVFKVYDKILTNSVATSFAVTQKFFDKVLTDAISPSSTLIREQAKMITNTLTVSGDLSSEQKLIGLWYYVNGVATNFEDRPANSWSTSAHAVDSATCQAAAVTNWTTL